MHKKMKKLLSIVLVFAMLASLIVPSTGTTAMAATHMIEISDENDIIVSQQLKIMEGEQKQLKYKLIDCSMPNGAYIKWESEASLIASVNSDGLVSAHDSSKGASVRHWIDNDVRSVAIVGSALAAVLEGVLFNDTIDIDTMNTEAIVSVVRESMGLVSSSVADYLVAQLEERLNSLDTGISVTLYSADGEVLATDEIRVLVSNSDKWYASLIPNGAFITNKESLPTIVAVGGKLKLEGGVTPLRLGYGVTWSIDTDSIWTSGNDYATIDGDGNITFLKSGKIKVTVSPNADDLVSNLMDYINDAIGLGNSINTGDLASIIVKLLGLNISESALKTVLDILVTVTGLGSNAASLLTTATKTLANYLLKAGINDSITFEIVDNLQLDSFELSADKTSLEEGDITQVSLINILPVGASSQNVVWTSSDSSVASVDENGIVKARDAGGASSLNQKTVTITAEVGGVKSSVEITVKGKLITTPVDLSISGPANIDIGASQTYTAILYPSRSNSTVTWGILADDGTTVNYAGDTAASNSLASITKDGVLTGNNGGTVTIYAKVGLTGRIVATYQVYVGTLVEGISIDQGDYVVIDVPLYTSYALANTTLTATLLPLDAANKNVIWSVLSGNIEVNNSGVVRPKGLSAAYGVVQVKSFDGGYTDTCHVSFANYPVTGITFDKSEMTLIVGESGKITPTIAPTGTLNMGDASIKDVIWTSSDESTVTVNGGTVTPVDSGVATITGTTADGGYTAQCVVTVLPDKTELNYAIQLVDNSDLTQDDCSEEDWTALQEAYNVAKEVAQTEIVSQSTCDKAAQNIIDIYNRIGAYINVYGINITKDGADASDYVTVEVGTLQSYRGVTLQLGCNLIPDNAMYSEIKWESDHSDVTVDQNGLVTNADNSAGLAKITVTASDYTGNVAKDSVYVVFTKYPVTGVKLDQSSIEGKVYQTAKLKATVEPTGTLGIANASVDDLVWTSSDRNVVTVDDEGNLTYKSVGDAVITVTTLDGGFTATCDVRVSVNKDSLSSAINTVNNAAIIEDEYTVYSYNTLKSAYDTAVEIYNNENVTQSDVDAVTETLNSAYNNLVKLIPPQSAIIQLNGADVGDYVSKEVNLTTSLSYKNNSVQLSAKVLPLDSMYSTVEWTSSNSSITVDESGKCTPTENKECYSVITLTIKDERGHTVTDSVQVSFARYPVNKVKITPAEVNTPLDVAPVKLTVKCFNETTLITYDATIQDVVWTSSNPDVVAVDSTGQLTYHDAGEAIITATSADGGVTGTCKVIVGGDKEALRAAIATVEAANVNIQDHTYETSTAYTAAYEYAKTVEAGTTYTQQEIDNAKQQLLSAFEALAPYVHMETLNLYYNGAPCPEAIPIKVSVLQIYSNQSVQLSYDFAPADAMYSSITWSSSSSALKVENGKVSPASNRAAGGLVTLTATDHYGNTISKSVYVSFANYPVVSITLDKTSMDVSYGAEPQTLTATLKADRTIGDTPSITDVHWFTSDPDVATVSGGVVTFVEAGTCTITAISVDGGLKATCTVTVTSDKTKLSETFAMINGMNLSSGDYTEESWSVLEKALEDAESVLTAENPKQRDINSANDALSSAYANLEKYHKLNNIILTKDGADIGEHISVNVPLTSIYTTQSVTLAYRSDPADASIKSIVWSSSNDKVKVENGKVSPAENSACYALITVTATDYNNNVRSDSVYVSFAKYQVTGITVDKTSVTNAVVGGSETVTATVQPTGTLGVGAANVTDVIWASSDENVATVNGGVVNFVGTGSCTITATTVDGGFKATTSVKVYADKSELKVAVDTASELLEKDYTPASWATFSKILESAMTVYNAEDPSQTIVNTATEELNKAIEALVKYIYVDSIGITYNGNVSEYIAVIVPEDQSYFLSSAQLGFVTNPEDAMYVSSEWSYEGDILVNMNGVAVPATNSACVGKVKVTLTDEFENVYVKEATIAFVKNPATSITIDPSEVTTHMGAEDFTLTATVLGANGTTADFSDVVWSSSDESIATVDENGLVHILNGGVVTIKATTVVGGLEASCVITVTTDKTVLEKTIADAEKAGYKEQDYTAETYSAFVHSLNSAKAVYNNEKASQAEIDKAISDLLTAITNLSEYVRIKNLVITYNNTEAPDFISIDVPLLSLFTSQSVALSYNFTPANAMYTSIVWSTDSTTVTLTQDGVVKPSANKACYAKIILTATDHFGNTVTDIVYVSFVKTVVTGVEIDKTVLNGTIGGSDKITATVKPTGTLNIGAADIKDVVWYTSDPTVATVDAQGNVTYVDGGTATITVKTVDGGHSASCSVTVTISKTALREAITRAESYQLSLFKDETKTAITNALNNAKSVYNNSNAKTADINSAIAMIDEALSNIQYLDGDYTNVNEAVKAYEALDESKYTPESYKAVKDAVEAVDYTLDIRSQSLIEEMAGRIYTAINELQKIQITKVSAISSTTVINEENSYIYGVDEGIDSLADYIKVENGSLRYVETEEGFGTGTLVEVLNNDGNVIKTYTLIIFGDANGDGYCDVLDTYLVNLYINYSVELSEAELFASDIMNDGVVDESDMLLLEAAGVFLYTVSQTR